MKDYSREFTPGSVAIVGAGTGDAGLLTVKALQYLQAADIVVYDRLISPEILELAPRGAMRIFAGKSCKHKSTTQEEINQTLVTMARRNKRVLRLKGGDPFIFGRGGEETEALARHNIPFTVIPGISAASACASYAGIPLTYRGMASGVRYITGHMMMKSDAAAAAASNSLELNWSNLAGDQESTLVVYMGLTHLDVIATKLIEHGMPADTPTAAICQAGTAEQLCVVNTLSEIYKAVHKAKVEPPVTIIIGRVVSLAERLHNNSTLSATHKRCGT